jgi:hypothetical protein
MRHGCSRPAQEGSDLCAKCNHLARAFRSVAEEWGGGRPAEEPLTELEVDLTISLMSRERFHRDVYEWLGKDAA